MSGRSPSNARPRPDQVLIDIADYVADYRIRSSEAYDTARLCLMKGNLVAMDYEDDVARDPRVDALRAKMVCVENRQWSRDYLNPAKRSIANAVQVFFKDGARTENVVVEYPVGHRRRRREGIPLLEAKFRANLARRFPEKQRQGIFALCQDQKRLEATPVNEFVDMFVV